MVLPDIAQSYDQNSVIILPRREGGVKTLKEKLEEGKGEKSPDSVQSKPQSQLPKGITSTRSGAGQPLVVTKNPNKKLDQKEIALTDAYAKHLYTSVCSEEYKDRLVPNTEKGIDKQKMWADIQTSCKCLSDAIVSQSSAVELSDYVMYSYSAQDDKQDDPELMQYYDSGQSDKIGALVTNDELRKKCGFLK